MRLDEATTREIVRRILSISQPVKIILFGSAARDEMTADSDVDLLIIEPACPDARAESARIRRRLRGLGPAFDVIVIDAQWFEDSKDVIGGIAYPADKHGRVIYDAA